MTDVLKIAFDLRSELQSEIAELDKFLDMADTLMRDARQDQATVPTSTPPKPPAADQEAPARPDAEPKDDEPKKEPRSGFLRRAAAN